jgi:hypothetical protein
MSMEYFLNLKLMPLKNQTLIETTEIQILTLVMITFLLGFVIGDYVSKK